MVKRILLALLAIVVILVLVAFLLPRKIHVERTVSIKAPAERIFAEVNSLKKWQAWSPWHQLEPDAEYIYSGPEEGVDCKSEWKGEKIGVGSQLITKSSRYDRIETTLDFADQGTAESFWTFLPDGESTKVTWGFDTDMGINPIARYMGLMMDSWIGADYEKGLNNLKKICESEPDNQESSPES